jgi:hypothetical protein
MLSGAEQAYQSQLEGMEREEQKKEAVKTIEQQGGLLGLFEGKKRLIDAFKKKINDKVDELTQKVKSKAEDVMGNVQEKAEDVMGQVQEGVEGLQQQAGEVLEQVPEVVIPRRVPLSREDYDAIDQQVRDDVDEFSKNLLGHHDFQDDFDLEAQRIYRGSVKTLNDMQELDPNSVKYRIKNRMLEKDKADIEDVLARKEEAMGEGTPLRINRVPTEEQFDEIKRYTEQRHNELYEQRRAELNPEPQPQQPPSGQIGQEAIQAPEAPIGQIGEEVQTVGQQAGEIAETSFDVVRQGVSDIGQAVSQIGKTAVKEAGEAVGEGLGEELAGESSLLAVPGVGELLAPLAFIGSALGAIFGHKKQPRGPVMSGVSSQFGG